MSRKSSKSGNSDQDAPESILSADNIETLSETVFMPSVEQRRCKAAFWAKFNRNPLVSADKITVAVVQKMVPDSRIPKWWGMYGFREWFLNEDEFCQRIEYSVTKALDALDRLLDNPDANHSAIVNAAKLMFEVSNKMPQRWQKVAYLDDQIQKMDQAQLEQYIRQRSLNLIEEGQNGQSTSKEDSPEEPT